MSAVLIVGFGVLFISHATGGAQTDRMEVSAYFPDGAGVVRPNSPVTDRGVTIGQVTGVAFTSVGVRLDMSIDDTAKIGLDATATIQPAAAPSQTGQNGEPGQDSENTRYSVDLLSDQPAGPYLGDGSVIPRGRTEGPPQQTLAGLLSTVQAMSGISRATT